MRIPGRMGVPILVRQHLHIETVPRASADMVLVHILQNILSPAWVGWNFYMPLLFFPAGKLCWASMFGQCWFCHPISGQLQLGWTYCLGIDMCIITFISGEAGIKKKTTSTTEYKFIHVISLLSKKLFRRHAILILSNITWTHWGRDKIANILQTFSEAFFLNQSHPNSYFSEIYS